MAAKTNCDAATSAKVTAGPDATISSAPRAGPAARATVIGHDETATTLGSSVRRTREGSRACVAGPLRANPVPMTAAAERRMSGPTPAAKPTAASQPAISAGPNPATSVPATIWRRRSARSARPPDHGLMRTCGRNCAMVMAATHCVERVRSHIRIAAATLWVQTPIVASAWPQK